MAEWLLQLSDTKCLSGFEGSIPNSSSYFLLNNQDTKVKTFAVGVTSFSDIKCYKESWKLFNDLKGDEMVMTLNQESGESEWQLPTAYLEFDNNDLGGEMFKIILEGENGKESELVVSEKHRVYSASRKPFSSLVLNTSITFVTDGSLKCGSCDQIGQSNLSANAKYCLSSGSDINDLAQFNCCGETLTFKLTNLDNISISLLNLSLETFNNLQSSCECSSNSAKIKDFWGPENFYFLKFSLASRMNLCEYSSKECSCANLLANDPFFNNENAILASTTNLIYISSLDSFANLSLTDLANLKQSSSVNSLSLVNSSSSSNASFLSDLSNSDSTAFMNILANAKFDNLDILSLNSSGILIDNSAILIDNKGDDDYKKLLVDDFELENVTKVYSDFNEGEDVWFLDEEGNSVKVLDIKKVDYDGQIYDVDVGNDVVLVRRGEGVALWSGNSNNGTAFGDAVQTDAGYLGKGFEFDGINGGDYIAIGTGTEFSDVCDNGCSFSVWIFKKDTGTNGGVLSRYDQTGNNRFFRLRISSSEDTEFVISQNGSADDCKINYIGGDITANTWYHYVGIYDNSTGTGNVSLCQELRKPRLSRRGDS